MQWSCKVGVTETQLDYVAGPTELNAVHSRPPSPGWTEGPVTFLPGGEGPLLPTHSPVARLLSRSRAPTEAARASLTRHVQGGKTRLRPLSLTLDSHAPSHTTRAQP